MYGFFSLVLALCISCTTGPTGELKWDATIGSMGVPQSPSATPTYPTTITPPVDGDPLSAPQLNIDVETKLQNGVEAARLQNYGGGIQRRVKCTGSGAGALTIQPLGAIAVTVAGQWTVFPDLTGSASERVTSGALNPTTLAGGALVVSTRYWIYAFGSGGKIDFIASTVAPDAGLRYSSAPSTDYLYVSTFWVDAAGNIATYNQSGNKYTFRTIDTPNSVLTLGAATVKTTVNAPPVPNQASEFQLYCIPSSAADHIVTFYGTGLAAFAEEVAVNVTGLTSPYTRVITIPVVTATASFDYVWSGAPGGGNGMTCVVKSFTL